MIWLKRKSCLSAGGLLKQTPFLGTYFGTAASGCRARGFYVPKLEFAGSTAFWPIAEAQQIGLKTHSKNNPDQCESPSRFLRW
jgi:hypothetical protein